MVLDAVLTSQQRMVRDAVRQFVRASVTPATHACDDAADAPVEICREFYAQGWLERFVPDDHGRDAAYLVEGCIVAEELAYACAGVASLITLPMFMARLAVLHLPAGHAAAFRKRVLEAGLLTAFAASEHEAGSDLLSLQTTAQRADGGYRINGQKAFSSNARQASFIIVIARTDTASGRSSRAFSAFLVPADAPGVAIGDRWPTLGLRCADVAPVTFTDVFVREEARLGAEGDGLALLAQHIGQSRTGIAATGIGIARRARDEVLRYGTRRRLAGEKLTHFQDYRFQIAEMETDIAAASALVWFSARKSDARQAHAKEGSIAKLYAGQMAMRVTAAASLMMGSLGYTRAQLVEKLLRDARYVGIVEGPDPVQKELVFAELLRRGAY